MEGPVPNSDKSNKSTAPNSMKNSKKKRDTPKDITTQIHFQYENFSDKNEEYIPLFIAKQSTITEENNDILNQSRFRFIVNSNSQYLKKCNNFMDKEYENIFWDDITYIYYYCVEQYQCPICLEQNLICPVITRCGHIFCYPCIRNFFEYSTKKAINKKLPKCPLCSDLIENLSLLKFCEIVQCYNYSLMENNKIFFNLIMREKTSVNLFNVNYDPDLKMWMKFEKEIMNKVPFENYDGFSFSRVFYQKKEGIKRLYKNRLSCLESGLKEEQDFYADEGRIQAFVLCIDEVKQLLKEAEKIIDFEYSEPNEEKSKENTSENPKDEGEETQKENEEIDYKKYFFFYQEKFGDIYFLHPLNYQMLLTEYGLECNLPTQISGKILDIEMIQMNRYLKSKYSFLSHLRNGSVFFFVEIDLYNYISSETRKKFDKELKERQKYRKMLNKEEKHYEKFIKRREQQNPETEYLIEANNEYISFKNFLDENNELNKAEEEKENKEENNPPEKKESMLNKLFSGELDKRPVLHKTGFVLENEDVPDKPPENEGETQKENNPNIVEPIKKEPTVSSKKGNKKGKKKFKNVGQEEMSGITFGFDLAEKEEQEKKEKEDKKEDKKEKKLNKKNGKK
ncbi:MAG: RING-HC finger protein [archaeon]|nr:RING-HC finger protein [archaeon]